MASLQPKFDFAAMADVDIALHGLNAARTAFDYDVKCGLTNGNALAIVVGVFEDDEWQEHGSRCFGPDGEGAEFLPNIDPETGKLATALRYEMDSVDANWFDGPLIPMGPMRYTGGVYYRARVQTEENGWMERIYSGAASGVQGHIDQATVYTALTRMAALWALKMQALYGKPS